MAPHHGNCDRRMFVVYTVMIVLCGYNLGLGLWQIIFASRQPMGDLFVQLLICGILQLLCFLDQTGLIVMTEEHMTSKFGMTTFVVMMYCLMYAFIAALHIIIACEIDELQYFGAFAAVEIFGILSKSVIISHNCYVHFSPKGKQLESERLVKRTMTYNVVKMVEQMQADGEFDDKVDEKVVKEAEVVQI